LRGAKAQSSTTDPKALGTQTGRNCYRGSCTPSCELCGSQEGVQVHHVRSLKDLKRKGRAEKPGWVKQMASRQRKTLVVCQKCHTDIHAGRHSKHAAKKRI